MRRETAVKGEDISRHDRDSNPPPCEFFVEVLRSESSAVDLALESQDVALQIIVVFPQLL